MYDKDFRMERNIIERDRRKEKKEKQGARKSTIIVMLAQNINMNISTSMA